jgi:hypothetical protein
VELDHALQVRRRELAILKSAYGRVVEEEVTKEITLTVILVLSWRLSLSTVSPPLS